MSTILVILITLTLCLASGGLRAVEEKTAPGLDPKLMELMKTGPEHQQLARLAGNWTVNCRFWMAPDAPPTESQGTIAFTPVFDGRFISGEFISTMHGQPFQGHSLNGYDRVARQYVSVWYDSMGTGVTRLAGTSSDGGRTITYGGETVCPQDGLVQLRQIETHLSDDRFTLVAYQTKDGKERKTMELTYLRRQ